MPGNECACDVAVATEVVAHVIFNLMMVSK